MTSTATDAVGAARTLPGQSRPSQTAEMVCALRALETGRADGLIRDDYARHLLSTPLYRRLSGRRAGRLTRPVFDRLYPGYIGIVVLRQRWYEDLLSDALRDGIRQVVLLGAGLDTSGLRLAFGEATLYEVDAPPTQQSKRAMLAAAGVTPPAHVTYVPCDFECDDLTAALTRHGFRPEEPALVVWYGVTFFLSAAAVETTLSDVRRLTAPGSLLAWDYIDATVVDGSTPFVGARRARRVVEKRGEPYTFGLRRGDVAALMSRSGFAVTQHQTLADLAARYGGPGVLRARTDDFVRVVTARRVAE